MSTQQLTLRRLFPRPVNPAGVWSWLTTVDHKRIGIMYGASAFFFLLVGGLEALIMRLQLALPNQSVVSAQVFNELFTMHGTTMIFLAVMPLSAAFINYLLPLQLGARDVAFPRLNAFSYWLFVFGGLFLNSSWLFGQVPNAGWFGYAPLTSPAFTPGLGVDFWVLGLQLVGISTFVSGFNFIVTIFNLRAPGMTLMRMPMFCWTTLVTSFLIVFSMPAVTVALFMLMFDRFFGANFFVTSAAGDVVLWQHLFWVFGHPEVYILVLPAMGIVSEILPAFAKKPLFGYSIMVFSTALIGFLGFGVWSHHMFAVGQGPIVNTIFSLTTMAIAIPTGVKIFNWLSTLWGGRIKFTTAAMFAVGFIAEFTIGGLSGVMLASAPSDMQQTDTYFVVAHFHYVLIGGALLAIFGGIYYWFPKVFGRMLDERLGKVNFWLLIIGFNTAFFPMHFLGAEGMPRRIYTYAANMNWTSLNLLATFGAFVIGLSVLVGTYNILVSLRKGERAVADPWDGRTLEWATPSPPPVYNFAQVPVVTSRDAFWEQKHPGTLHDGDDAAGSKKGTNDTGDIHLPEPSWMPMLVALGLTVSGYGGIFKNGTVVLVALGTAVLFIYGWAFEGAGGIIIHTEERGDVDAARGAAS